MGFDASAGLSISPNGQFFTSLNLVPPMLPTRYFINLTQPEIAAQLKKTEGSVKVQLSGIFQKLRVNSRAKLMVALRS